MLFFRFFFENFFPGHFAISGSMIAPFVSEILQPGFFVTRRTEEEEEEEDRGIVYSSSWIGN